MPPVDLASGDKHAPVKPAAARWPAVAPSSAIGLEGAHRPGWRAQPSRHRRRRVRHRHAHGAEQCDELASPLGSHLLTSAPRYIVEQEDGRCAHHSENDRDDAAAKQTIANVQSAEKMSCGDEVGSWFQYLTRGPLKSYFLPPPTYFRPPPKALL